MPLTESSALRDALDIDVLGPASLVVEKKAKVSDSVRRVNRIVGNDCRMQEVKVRRRVW